MSDKKRNSCKKRVADFAKFVTNKQVSFNNGTITKAELIELDMRMQTLIPVLNEFYELSELIKTNKNSDQESEIIEAFENEYFENLSKAKYLIESANKCVPPASTSFSVPNIMHNNGNAQIRLPIINLPVFRGERTTFLEFRDTYEALIHNNNDISDIQKLHYLKASLEGSAKQIIQHIDITAGNYNIAWDLLCARYENKRLLIKNHLSELLNINKIENESASKLRNLLDNMNKHLGALKSLGENVNNWDTIIVHTISSKFDEATERQWEQFKPAGNFPTKQELINFLTERTDMLDSLNANNVKANVKQKTGVKFNKAENNTSLLSNISCYFCKEAHTIYNCDKFISFPVNTRIVETKKLGLCMNCLRPGHTDKECQSSGCRKCKYKHNTLLHFTQSEPKTESAVNTVALSAQTNISEFTLLPTAIVNVMESDGGFQKCRVLLDSGSQSNFISEKTAIRLRLKIGPFDMQINGINNCTTGIIGRSSITIKSYHTKFKATIECLVLPIVSHALPQVTINVNSWEIPNNIKLADPQFKKSNEIDILLGAGIFSRVLLQNQINLGQDDPLLQNTLLGWVVFGPMSYDAMLPASDVKCYFSVTNEKQIVNQLRQFWEIEECPRSFEQSDEEKECEEHFVRTHSRDTDGRFVVSIPLKGETSTLGESINLARKRFYTLERKLISKLDVRTMYIDFLKEYEAIRYMSKIPDIENWNGIQYIIPHHGVINESSTTTKLRVVFDASFKTNTGISRNDLECVGPVLQDDLFTILIRFRQHAIAITGDIEKMYRQVLIKPNERHLQRILFRADPASKLEAYELNTVTYGTASASFLAIRALHQLAIENLTEYPNASKIITSDFYVDDLLTGSDTVESAKELCQQISQVLRQGGFPIRKWVSNDANAVITLRDENEREQFLEIGKNECTKVLGLQWNPNTDNFRYKIDINFEFACTKRNILATISRIFDPLGLVGPCVIRSKILLQTLWQNKVDWDDQVSGEVKCNWIKFRNDLNMLSSIKIPRRITANTKGSIQIHGFADASEKAYGACVYMRTINDEGNIICNLICAKSKVAPLKTLTIPRLELCAALLLSRLIQKVISSIRLTVDEIYAWSDSTIVLGWMKTPVHLLKIFVANRVVQISEIIGDAMWRFVPTAHNPADLISRGVDANALLTSKIWWQGPEYLLVSEAAWPRSPKCNHKLPDMRPTTTVLVNTIKTLIIDYDRFSNFSRLRRTIAYSFRFINSCKKNKRIENCNSLSLAELERAETQIIKQIQGECFAKEIHALVNNGEIDNKSKLTALVPFLDEKGILRVRGRLQNSGLNYDKMHPIIIPAKHHVSKLIFRFEHKRLGHAGPQLLLCAIREKYWPMRGRDMARRAVHECVRCYWAKPTNHIPIMGATPGVRVKPSFPFENTGVDYAGPFLIKNKKGRGAKTTKCYVSLFVCLSTKAIHLETVVDLTTEAFLAALRRFIARRGKPKTIYSDNATNFVGAKNELTQIVRTLETNENTIKDSLAEEGVEWHFIPPQAPHFGGIWEAGVKSMKYYFKRILANALLTFEEFTTVCCQVESILNSRPVCPLTNNPEDLEALTPAHFLIGRNMTSLIDQDLQDLPVNRLSNFQRAQQAIQHLWTHWTKEYLPTLQVRQKWNKEAKAIQESQLVIIQDDNAPPLKWVLGRIIEQHPGKDGVVRVVTLRTQKGVLKRPVSKLFPLPLNDYE